MLLHLSALLVSATAFGPRIAPVARGPLTRRRSTESADAADAAPADAKTARAVWRVALNVGREKGSWMPDEWAKSGARLALGVECAFTDDQFFGSPEPLVGRTSFSVRPVGEAPTFVGVGGTTAVRVESGGWAVMPPEPGKRPATLRFWLEFPEAATRNDVELPAGRVFGTAPVWQEAELSYAAAELEAAEADLAAAVAALASHAEDFGETPLNPFTFRERVRLVDDTSAAKRRVGRIKEFLPANDPVAGPFPGLATGSALAIGKGGLVVKRKATLIGAEYHIIGSFTAAPSKDPGG